MNANTVEGAKKTALYFLRLFPYALTTGDLKEFNALSYRGHGDADCGFCSSTRSQVKEYVKSHKTYSGGAISARVVKSYDRDALYDLYPLDIEVEQARGVVHAADGSVDSYTRASSNVARVEVIRVENGWKILTVTHAKSDS